MSKSSVPDGMRLAEIRRRIESSSVSAHMPVIALEDAIQLLAYVDHLEEMLADYTEPDVDGAGRTFESYLDRRERVGDVRGPEGL